MRLGWFAKNTLVEKKNNTTHLHSLRGSQERCAVFFCSNTLPFFAMHTLKIDRENLTFRWLDLSQINFCCLPYQIGEYSVEKLKIVPQWIQMRKLR